MTTSATIETTKDLMETLLETEDSKLYPKPDELIEGSVISQDKSMLFVDIAPFGTGTIYGKEFQNARDIIKNLKQGDKITAKITSIEDENGYIELSLKEAKEEIVWREVEEAQKAGTTFTLSIIGANKGGLIMEWRGIQSFLPASQLSTSNYPRIEDGNKDQVLDELKKMVGQKLTVTIINHDPKEEKIILSEKKTETEELKNIIAKHKVGDTIEGDITGVVEFGIFIKIEEGLEGLAHISELDWSLVENPANMFKVGDKIKAKIIEIKNEKISLSVKALKESPWEKIEEKYKKGDIVSGVVIKFNKHGALVSIEEGIAGLVHISEFETETAMRAEIELGKSYKFQITLFEPKEQRLTLSYAKEGKALTETEK